MKGSQSVNKYERKATARCCVPLMVECVISVILDDDDDMLRERKEKGGVNWR
jgi:hypothetical protein